MVIYLFQTDILGNNFLKTFFYSVKPDTPLKNYVILAVTTPFSF